MEKPSPNMTVKLAIMDLIQICYNGHNFGWFKVSQGVDQGPNWFWLLGLIILMNCSNQTKKYSPWNTQTVKVFSAVDEVWKLA